MKKLSKDLIKVLIYESLGLKKNYFCKERIREIVKEEVEKYGRIKNGQ